jgi:predicted dinucleotide-binding enzyme
VSALVDRIGYDAIPLGTLSAGRVLQPGGPVFGAVLRRGDFQRAVRGRAEEQKAFRLAEQHYERSA